MTTGKIIALTICTSVRKLMSLLFNMLSSFVIAFLPRSKCVSVSWLQLPSAVILEPKKIKSVTVFMVSLSIYHEVMGQDAMALVFWMLSFKATFLLSSFIFIIFHHFSSSSFSFTLLFSSSLLSAIGWCYLHIWGYWYFSQQFWFQLVLHLSWNFV